jgi:propanol-preferring alcohol dehydrogenase
MEALQFSAWKQDAALRRVEEPEPGPGEVLVRIGGAGACHSDLHVMHDFEAGIFPWALPFTLGHENAGWVEALGPGATGLEVGEPVAVYGPWGCGRCHRCSQGTENYCERAAELPGLGGGLGFDGGMAPLMVVRSPRHLVPLGDLDPVDAAPLTDAGLTPYHAIKRSLPLLLPGSTAVVIGAGGLGHLAIQILTAMSATTVVAVDQSPGALDLARSVGASHGVTPGEAAAAEIRELTQGRGADLVLDFVGVDATLSLGTAVLRPMGHLTLVGIGGGSTAFSFFSPAYEVSLASTYWGTRPELFEILALAAAGHVRAHVQRFPLTGAMDAYAAMARGDLHGRAVIVPGAP